MTQTIYLELGFQLDCHYLSGESATRDDPGCSDSMEINSIEALTWEISKYIDGKLQNIEHTIKISPELSEALLKALSGSLIEERLLDQALQDYRDFC